MRNVTLDTLTRQIGDGRYLCSTALSDAVLPVRIAVRWAVWEYADHELWIECL